MLPPYHLDTEQDPAVRAVAVDGRTHWKPSGTKHLQAVVASRSAVSSVREAPLGLPNHKMGAGEFEKATDTHLQLQLSFPGWKE